MSFSLGNPFSKLPLLPKFLLSQGSVDCPTLEFEYGDADGHAAELSGMKKMDWRQMEEYPGREGLCLFWGLLCGLHVAVEPRLCSAVLLCSIFQWSISLCCHISFYKLFLGHSSLYSVILLLFPADPLFYFSVFSGQFSSHYSPLSSSCHPCLCTHYFCRPLFIPFYPLLLTISFIKISVMSEENYITSRQLNKAGHVPCIHHSGCYESGIAHLIHLSVLGYVLS